MKLITLATTVIIILASLGLNSCNTMVGLGKDFQSLGRGLEATARGKKATDSSANPYN